MSIVGRKITKVFALLAIGIAVISSETACNAKSDGNPAGSNGSHKTAYSGNVKSDDFTGSWYGSVKTMDGKSVDVQLDISQLETNPNTLEVKYEKDRNCSLKAKYTSADNENKNIRNYTFNISADNPCDKLSLGSLSLQQSDNKLIYKAVSQDKKYSEGGELNRSQ